MDKYRALLNGLIVCSLALASCSQEVFKENNPPCRLSIVAWQDALGEGVNSTRTTLIDGVNVYWTAGDRLLVFSDEENACFSYDKSDASAEGSFSGVIRLPDQSSEDQYVRALYPYNSDASIKGGTVTTALPSLQTGAAGTFGNNLMILASRGVPTTSGQADAVSMDMTFKHLCSGIKFSLTRDDIKSVELSSRGGEPVAGVFSFNWNEKGNPVISSVASPSTSVILSAPSGGTFEKGVWYYIVTLPVNFSKGVSFSLINSEGKSAERIIQTAFSLGRGLFRSATDLDADLHFVDPGEDNPDVEVQVAGPDTWVAVDELQRSVNEDAPSTRSGKQVLMFYWTWHCESHADYPTIVDITGVQGLGGSYINDYTSYVWGVNQGHDPCFWGTPLFGYYRSTDPWVLRKHAEMLADAGVDAVFFDNSNGTFMWWSAVTQLLETWSQAKSDGVNVPKIAFLLPFSASSDAATQLRYLYSNLYGKGLYKDLWFMVDGKPCVMAYPSCLTSSATDQAIKNFFTFRPGQGDYVFGDQGGQWGWLEVAPQHLFNGEQMTVSVAQNATAASQGHCYAFNAPGSYGRSYTKASGHSKQTSKSYIYGYNFQEQWDRAIAVDPNYVFVTGWNEWTANRQDSWPVYSYCAPYANAFPDQYDSERSRDIEPNAVWGDNGDNYYYQLIKNVRRYKGVGNYPNVSKKVTMDIDGDFSAWEKVSPDFRHYAGNTLHRNHAYQSTRADLVYTNTSGRNDFVDAKVARDEEYIYFYIETAEDITSRTDEKWMRLFINIDRNWKTGWKGYDFCLNYRNPASATKGYVSKCKGTSWSWSDAGTFDYSLVGNKMEIRVSRSLLGVASDDLDFEFKWSDNMQEEGKILDFYSNGDCAPGGRFNFHYKEK